MITFDGNTFFDEDALLDRLTSGALENKRDIVFVVGAPLTAPITKGSKGVADVDAVTELIRQVFSGNQAQLAALDKELRCTENAYQTAFHFLQGRRGQDAANNIIRRAVLSATVGEQAALDVAALAQIQESDLAALDDDNEIWSLTPGVTALGELTSLTNSHFGKSIITSNFDPLIEVSIRKAGGNAWRTILHGDGNLEQSTAAGCQVIHMHGYWHGADTLHTGNQLSQSRPALKNSLLTMLQNKTVVVLAYGGWNDIFTGALESLVSNTASFPEIIWTFFSKTPKLSVDLKRILQAGVARNRVTFYADINCHTFLPKLVAAYRSLSTNSIQFPQTSEQAHKTTGAISLRERRIFAQLDCDRPPSLEVWVGREPELRSLETTSAKVIAICGLGGQGKSALAARYLKAVANGETRYEAWDWRDCKEEVDRIRTQICAAIQRMSNDKINNNALQSSSDSDLVDIFIALSNEFASVYVLDNVDQYVDLEHNTFVGILDLLVRKFAQSDTLSRIIITCRPMISYDLTSLITLSMKGLSREDAIELFTKRTTSENPATQEIEEAHKFTNGHAFWLDLMAAQVARVPGASLKRLIDDIKRGRGDTPDILSSIWSRLPEREHAVLRAMAETVRPETEDTLQRIVSAELNFKNFKKAIKSLISLNLIVLKREDNAPDLYDLHPLVRQFIRRNFDRPERYGYIQIVIAHYNTIICGINTLLGVNLPLSILERWSQKAELEVEAGIYGAAFDTLSKSMNALIGGGHVQEFVRVARKLFQAVDWAQSSSSISSFYLVLARLIDCLNVLEEFADADDLLRKYEETIPHKTARYISYCDTRCHTYWVRNQFELAIEWGNRGNELARQTNVDTSISCEHNLALAMRDGGDPEGALKLFLNSQSLDELIQHENTDITPKTGALYGNVGRCLQLMGDTRSALICYRYSAKILQSDQGATRLDNQAYARQWIAEILENMGEFGIALAFYVTAEDILRKFAPARARAVRLAINKLQLPPTEASYSTYSLQRIVDKWIDS